MSINFIAQALSEYAKIFGKEEKALTSSASSDSGLLSFVKSLREDLDMVSLWLVSDTGGKDLAVRLANITKNCGLLLEKTKADQVFLSDTKETYKGLVEKTQGLLNAYESEMQKKHTDKDEEEALARFRKGAEAFMAAQRKKGYIGYKSSADKSEAPAGTESKMHRAPVFTKT